jgi:hypothetical protein
MVQAFGDQLFAGAAFAIAGTGRLRRAAGPLDRVEEGKLCPTN